MGGFFLLRNAACSYPPPVEIPGANIWLNDACPDGQMMFLPIVKNDAASCGRNDAMCSAHARSAHHEAKPRIMPAGRIMFRGGGTHHSPSVLTNTRRMGGFFLSLGRARSYPPSGQKTPSFSGEKEAKDFLKRGKKRRYKANKIRKATRPYRVAFPVCLEGWNFNAERRPPRGLARPPPLARSVRPGSKTARTL